MVAPLDLSLTLPGLVHSIQGLSFSTIYLNVGSFKTCLTAFYRLFKHSEMTEFWRQFLAILPVYILQFCYGMSGAYPSVTTPQLTMDCALFSITPNQESNISTQLIICLAAWPLLWHFFLVSIDNLISPFICILSGSLQQKFGPRTILILNCFPYLLAWIGAALSGFFTNIWLLYISRYFILIKALFRSGGKWQGLMLPEIFTCL